MKAINAIKKTNEDGSVRMYCGNCGAEIVLTDMDRSCCSSISSELASGNYFLMPKMSDDSKAKLVKALEDAGLDPTEMKILQNGRIQSDYIWRRWIMALTFRWMGRDLEGYTPRIKMVTQQESLVYLMNEVHALAKQARDNDKALKVRSLFFTVDVVKEIMYDYFARANRELEARLNAGKKVKRYKDSCPISRESIQGWKDGLDLLRQAFFECNTYSELDYLLQRLFRNPGYVKVTDNKGACPEFVDAFKGAGAYYSMENMICGFKWFFPGMNEYQSMDRLMEMTREATKERECYKLLGVLKAFIKETDFDYHIELDERNGRV